MKVCFAFFIAIVTARALWAYTPISDDRRSELLGQFDYVPVIEVVKAPQIGCNGQELEYDTTYPQRETPYRVHAKTYIPNKAGSPVVFLLPPLGGANPLDKGMGAELCRNGIAVILLTNDFAGLNSGELMPVEDHDHTPRRVVAAIKGGLVLAQAVPQLDPAKAGLFGASLGGILGSIAYGVMPEISAATFIVNGGDVPNTLTYSDQGPVKRVKRQRMEAENLKNDAEYEHYLNQNLTLDPLHFAPLIPSDSLRLYLSKNDASVPTENQMAFYRAAGSPAETRFYSVNHAMTIFAVMGIGGEKQAIATWFNQRFAKANPREPSAVLNALAVYF